MAAAAHRASTQPVDPGVPNSRMAATATRSCPISTNVAVAAIPTGLLYGALPRHPPASVVLVLLTMTTVLVAAAPDRTWFIVLLTLSGSVSSPTVTAVTDELSRVVPPGNRGEAMGWHGSATTLGNAAGAPVAGLAIDGAGWAGGLLAVGVLGLAIALVGLATRRRVTAPTPARSPAARG